MPKTAHGDVSTRSQNHEFRSQSYSATIPGQLTVHFSVPIEIFKEALVSGTNLSAIDNIKKRYLNARQSRSTVGIQLVKRRKSFHVGDNKFTPLADFGAGIEILPLGKSIFTSNLVVSSKLSIGKYEYKGYNRVSVFVTLQNRFAAGAVDTLAGLNNHHRHVFRFLFLRTYDWGSLHRCQSQQPGDDYLLFKATKGRPDTEISNPHVVCELSPPKFIARER